MEDLLLHMDRGVQGVNEMVTHRKRKALSSSISVPRGKEDGARRLT